MLANRMMMTQKGYDAYTKAMLHFDGANASTTFNDEIGKIWTPNSATISTVQSKFGGSSALFSGSGWIDTPDSVDFTLGTSDFTFDFWLYRNTASTMQYVFGQCDTSGSITTASFICYFNPSNFMEIDFYTGTTNILLASGGMGTGAWNHVAFVRSGSTFYFFINGTLNATVTGNSNALVDSASKFSIGRKGEYISSVFNGYIDEFRFSKGIARWTANFTPPTAPY